MSVAHRLLGACAATLALVPAASMAAPAPAAVPAPVYAATDWKQLDPQTLMVIDTNKGRIVVELRPEFSKEHVDQITALTKQGYYNGLQFFRVIDDFMAQTGDKANTGAGKAEGVPFLKGAFTFKRGPDVPFPNVRDGQGETVGFVGANPATSQPDGLMAMTADGTVKATGLFCAGVAGMARTGEPDSASSQFFLMRQERDNLDGKYTPWGRVVVGLDVVRAIAQGEPPPKPDIMTKVMIAADMPAGDRPKVWRIDTSSAAFKAHLAAAAAAAGTGPFTPCDVEVPGEIRK